MKLIISTAAAMLIGTAASAGIFGLPAHQPDGFRDTGCDPDQQVAVEGTNYFNNPTCPDVRGARNADFVAGIVEKMRADRDDDGEGDETDDDNGEGSETSEGNDDEEFVGGVGW